MFGPLGTFGTIFLIVSILFGGGGVTFAAAQSSMPDQPLYTVKTWSENVRTQMTTGEMNQLRFALELAERRAEEMQVMFRAGQTPPQAVQNRWEGQLDEALRLAAGLTHDPQFQAHLEQIRTMAQVQQQAFEQVGLQKDPAGEALLTRTRAKLGEVLMLCKQGQQDPNAFQQKVQAMEKKQLKDGDQAGDQSQEQNQEQNQEKNQEQNGEPAGDPNQEQNREQHQVQECGSEDGCDGEGPYGPGEGSGPGPGDGSGGSAEEGSGGSGGNDPGSENTGGSYSGSGSTGSDNTGGDASGSESNGNGDTGGSDGGGDSGGSGGGGDSGGSGGGGDSGGSGGGGGGGGK